MLVVGAGPAGLAAAMAAGETGARVIVVDEQPAFGGALLAESGRHVQIVDDTPDAWLASATEALAGLPEVTMLPRTTAFGYYADNFIGLLERVTDHLPAEAADCKPRQRLWKVRAKQVMLATGSIERSLVFAENDRPGIMLAGAARVYVKPL